MSSPTLTVPDRVQQMPAGRQAHRASASSMILLIITAVLGFLAMTWPLFVKPDAALLGENSVRSSTAVFMMAGLLLVLLALTIAQLSNDDLDVKAVAMLGVLTAVGAVLRPLSAGTAGVELIWAMIILGSRVYGPGFGFLLGNSTMFASALLTGGVGPWLPYQMVGAGFVGLGAGLLPKLRGAAEIVTLAVYGFIAAFFYGILLDLAFWPFYFKGTDAAFDPHVGILENLHRFFIVNLVTGMGWNLGRAITNVVFIAVLGTPILKVLRRAARRASFAVNA